MVIHSGSCLQLAAKPVQAAKKGHLSLGVLTNVQRMDNWNAKDMVKKIPTSYKYMHSFTAYTLHIFSGTG